MAFTDWSWVLTAEGQVVEELPEITQGINIIFKSSVGNTWENKEAIMSQGTCLSAQKCCFTSTCHFWGMSAADYAVIALSSPPITEDGISHTTYLQADFQFMQPAPSVLYLFKGHSLKRSPCYNVTYSEKLSLARPWHAHPPNIPVLYRSSLRTFSCYTCLFISLFTAWHLP